MFYALLLNLLGPLQGIFGKNQLPEKEDNKLLKLAAEFVQPMPLMIWAAIFIEARREPRLLRPFTSPDPCAS